MQEDGSRPSGLVLPPGARVDGDKPLPLDEELHPIRTTISIEQKVRLAQWESASVSIILSGVPTGATPGMIDEALDTGKIVYDKMRERLVARVRAVREKKGFGHSYDTP